jgi:hypothetical protein
LDCKKIQVDRKTLIALISLAVRRGRLVAFVKLGLEVDRTLLDQGGDRQAGYPIAYLCVSLTW